MCCIRSETARVHANCNAGQRWQRLDENMMKGGCPRAEQGYEKGWLMWQSFAYGNCEKWSWHFVSNTFRFRYQSHFSLIKCQTTKIICVSFTINSLVQSDPLLQLLNCIWPTPLCSLSLFLWLNGRSSCDQEVARNFVSAWFTNICMPQHFSTNKHRKNIENARNKKLKGKLKEIHNPKPKLQGNVKLKLVEIHLRLLSFLWSVWWTE